ncbi:MAG: TIGR03617 family F420-dependent LLM class oxidoreductase [Solirubrobacteraceae bacterium]
MAPVSITLRGTPLADFAAEAARAEGLGYDGVFSTESANDPFLPIALAAGATERIRLGTAIAVAFPRSPLQTAHSAWDLQRLTGGRFVLGLGTQVRAHVERRFSAPFDHPAPRMREYVQALRAIWTAWQEGAPLDFAGRFYTHTLMPPNFRPAPLDGPPPPIYLAAVRERMLAVAGEVADGVLLHAFLTEQHLRDVVLPALGTRDLHVACGLFVATTEEEWESARRRVAFYGSTPGYWSVLETHGLRDLGERLHACTKENRWAQMPALVGDDVLALFCVRTPEEAAGRAALVDSIGLNGGADADLAALAPFAQAIAAR